MWWVLSNCRKRAVNFQKLWWETKSSQKLQQLTIRFLNSRHQAKLAAKSNRPSNSWNLSDLSGQPFSRKVQHYLSEGINTKKSYYNQLKNHIFVERKWFLQRNSKLYRGIKLYVLFCFVFSLPVIIIFFWREVLLSRQSIMKNEFLSKTMRTSAKNLIYRVFAIFCNRMS